MMIDSVAQTATLTSLAFFLINSLSTISAAPTLYNTDTTNVKMIEPWLQPCGSSYVAAYETIPRRHSVHRTLKRVRTQLRVARNHLKKNLKDVDEIYEKTFEAFEEQHKLNWLPEKEFEWYYKKIWCLEKGEKAERVLPHLFDALQRFAITFYHLKSYHLVSYADLNRINRRNQIINGIYYEVLKLLCEVEASILRLDLALPKFHHSVIVTENPGWLEKGDFTTMMVQDTGVLRIYRNFLSDWTRAFLNATKVGPGTCDFNQIKPLSRPKRPKVHKKLKKKPNPLRSKKRMNKSANRRTTVRPKKIQRGKLKRLLRFNTTTAIL